MIEKIKKMKEVIIVGASATILCIVTIWQAYQKYKSDEKADEEREKAEQARIDANKSQQQAIKYLELLNNKNTEIQKLQKANIDKSEKIIKDQNETLKHITGNGVPEIKIGGSKTNNYIITLLNSSNYPMYDLFIQQINLTELSQKEPVKIDGVEYVNESAYESLTKSYVSGSAVSAKKSVRIPINLHKTNYPEFILYRITTRHGTFMQYCAIQNIPERNEIHYRFILFQLINGDYVEIESNLNENGKKFFQDKCPFYKKEIIVFISQ